MRHIDEDDEQNKSDDQSKQLRKSQSATNIERNFKNIEFCKDIQHGIRTNRQSVDSNLDPSQAGGRSIDHCHSQGEVSNVIMENEGMKPEKTIVAQVKNLDSRSKLYKQKTLEIMNRIVSTMISWELFSDEQIQDANIALKMLQQSFI